MPEFHASWKCTKWSLNGLLYCGQQKDDNRKLKIINLLAQCNQYLDRLGSSDMPKKKKDMAKELKTELNIKYNVSKIVYAKGEEVEKELTMWAAKLNSQLQAAIAAKTRALALAPAPAPAPASASASASISLSALSPPASPLSSASSRQASSSSSSFSTEVVSATAATLVRSGSMSATHANSGGVRSQARLQVGIVVRYTDMYGAGVGFPEGVGKRVEKIKVVPSGNSEKDLAKNDAERSVINEMSAKKFWRPLQDMSPSECATLEFHGNFGPCGPCQQAIVEAAKRLAMRMWEDTYLEVRVIYAVETDVHWRGVVKSIYGYEKSEVSGAPLYGDDYVYTYTVGKYKGTINRSNDVNSNSIKNRATSNRTPFSYDVLQEESSGKSK